MSIVTELNRKDDNSETTIKGVENSTATYEITDEYLIIRTNTYDTIHITREMGKRIVSVIVNEFL